MGVCKALSRIVVVKYSGNPASSKFPPASSRRCRGRVGHRRRCWVEAKPKPNPADTRDTADTVCGMVTVAKIRHRTRHRHTRDPNTAGHTEPVTNPKSTQACNEVHYHSFVPLSDPRPDPDLGHGIDT